MEGWTAPLDWVLKTNGMPQDVRDMTVEAVIKTAGGVRISTTDDVVVTLSTGGLVRLNADQVDFRAYRSPYTLRFLVTDVGGKIAYFPSGEPITIRVRKP